MSRFQEEFILLNVEEDERVKLDKEYQDKIEYFGVIHNPQALSNFYAKVENARHPVEVSLTQSVIEWAMSDDYWIDLDIPSLIPILEEVEKDGGPV